MIPATSQFMVMVSMQLAALSVGGFLVFPTQVMQQLKANDSNINMDIGTASWIGSIYGFAGIPVIFLPILMQWLGRKYIYMVTCAFVIAGWGLSISANNTALLLTSEVFQGLSTNSLLPVSCLIMTEMLSPRYRFLSMQFFGLSMSVGMAIVGISGRFIHFKTFSIMMLVPTLISAALAFTWPESPPWLACKGKFDRCERAYLKLRGNDEKSICELNQLITAQKENIAVTNYTQKFTWKGFWAQITSRDFYMPSLHIFILQNMLYSSGGDVVLVYFLEFVEKTTQSQDAVFYAGIVLYTIVLLGCIITHFTVKHFKNKTVLLCSTGGVIVSLFCICIVTYLQSVGVVANDSYLCMYCLIGFMTFNSLGLNALVFYIAAELMPVKHRSIGGALYIIINCGLYAFTLKLSPYLMIYIEMWGLFTIFTINAIASVFVVWRYIPETKGRTLQELEDFYTYGRFIQRDDVKHGELLS